MNGVKRTFNGLERIFLVLLVKADRKSYLRFSAKKCQFANSEIPIDMPKKEISKTYTLSENSRKSSADFQSANKLSSALYMIFKSLLPRIANREHYQRLNKRVIRIMQSGSKEHLGQRKLYQGNVGLLKGFRLNTYTLWDSLIHFQPEISVVPTDGLIRIRIPSIKNIDWNLPPRASKMVIQFTCCEIDADNCLIEVHNTAKLTLSPTKEELISRAKKITLRVPQMEGKIILVLISMRTYLWEGDSSAFRIDKEDRLSNDRKYYAGEVLEAVYVKDGKVVEYVPKAAENMEVPEDWGAKIDAEWEEEE